MVTKRDKNPILTRKPGVILEKDQNRTYQKSSKLASQNSYEKVNRQKVSLGRLRNGPRTRLVGDKKKEVQQSEARSLHNRRRSNRP